MTSKFQSFDASSLGAFIQSQLNARGISGATPGLLTITALSKSIIDNNDTVTIYGEGFLSSQGNGFVLISGDSAGGTPIETQTVNSWSDTEIEITIDQGGFPDHEPQHLYVENNNGDNDSVTVLISPEIIFVSYEDSEPGQPYDGDFWQMTYTDVSADSGITSPSNNDVFTTSDSINFAGLLKSIAPTIFSSYPRFRFEGRTSGAVLDFRGWDWQAGMFGGYTSTETGQNGTAQIFSDGDLLSFVGDDMFNGFTTGEAADVMLNVTADLADLSSSIEWESSLDGVIDTGSSINTSNLSAGEHTIIARVVWDSHPAVDLTLVLPTINIYVGIRIDGQGSPPMIEPDVGPDSGGTTVTINGDGFDENTTVTIGGNAATNINIVDRTELTCETPPVDTGQTLGFVDVTVSNGVDDDTLQDGFEYIETLTITDVTPDNGSTSGGTSVTVTGTAFSGDTFVKFSGSNATNITLVNDTTITCDTPSFPFPFTVDVTVDDGQQTDTLNGGFTYT